MINFISNTIQVHVACCAGPEFHYKFLALKRSKANPIYPQLWQAITGTIEENETAVECAIREVKEETGLSVKEIWTIPFVAVFFDPYQNAINASPVFGVLTDLNEQVEISAEHEDFCWLTLDEFLDRVPLPSHKLGAEYFWQYILSNHDKELFKYKGKV